MKKRIARDQAHKFAFDWRDEPSLRVQPGESFEVETDDASSGFFRNESDLAVPANRPGFDRSPPLANPLAGPIWVEGAERGDTLVVHIEDILVDDYSWIAVGPGRGPLGDSLRWSAVSAEYSTRIFRHTPGPSGTFRDGHLRFNDRIVWPITPFIGTMGTAPDREVATSLDGQGDWGGNLDVRDFAPGNRVFLPVYHPGGLLYLGDIHASQGDTEFCGTAAETRASVRLRVDIVHGRRAPGVRIETPESLIALHVYRPLEVAVETAVVRLMEWLMADYELSQVDAYCLVSACPDLRIHVYQMCQVAKLNYVAGAAVPKRLFAG